ncbi:nucleotide-binding universal stress UspA family protein [Sphingomonas vulcanisoli]|uniref:Nucleotide-binding universal stress UspA family protein n=1 Tax=Sphingomonas vulcanisoli TaxID=1658060 RepID=A0ABX0TYD3_9SPHN|nr:universal stress protein [Sphingomonas vulcanisoli]NIJ09390.1 nucleotide-binding universal stress UspA family protein [Sphingomonas vulcanisoli]
MKNVLLLVHDDSGQEARLQVALDLARGLDGHLQCLDVALMPMTVGAPYDGMFIGEMLADEVKREETNKAKLEHRLGREDVPFSWTDVTGDFESALADAAGMADIIVVNRKLTTFPYPDTRRTASELIVHSHRPVMAVPETTKSLDLFGRALVAWDGSTCASAAMIAAVPLLKLAEKVTILEVNDGSVDTPAEEAAAYLGRYGIHARIVRDEPMGQTVGQLLLTATETQAVDYVVMGGFGHRRTTEAIFGGATRTMLTESPVPVFLAH